jgi:hypothetical protein
LRTATDSPVSSDSSIVQAGRLEHPRVGGHAVALAEHDHVAPDDLAAGHDHLLAVTNHGGAGAR